MEPPASGENLHGFIVTEAGTNVSALTKLDLQPNHNYTNPNAPLKAFRIHPPAVWEMTVASDIKRPPFDAL